MTVRLLVALLMSAFFFALIGHAQSPQRPEPKFAVEIQGLAGFPPSYVTLAKNEASSWLYEGSLHRITGGDPSRHKPSALKLEYKVEGDVVLITAFSDMERFGLEPLTLKIVPAQPPSSIRPIAMSKAPSIQIEIVGEDRTFYKVALHNLSAKTVTAVHVAAPEKNGSSGQTVGYWKGLIAPGATYQLRFAIPRSGRMSNGSFVENPGPPLLVVETALFEDGSYEAMRKGPRRSRPAVWVRSSSGNESSLVEAILADTQSCDDAKLARIRSEVAQLTDDPDAQLLESVRTKFPGLSVRALQSVTSFLRTGLNHEKESLVRGLRDFEQANARSPGKFTLTLRQWWSSFSNLLR